MMKDDLAGGKLPSSDFGTNAAWWWIMIIALNLNVMLKNSGVGAFDEDETDEGHQVFNYQHPG